MDIDSVDVDAQLLQQFSAMATRDKDQLVDELKSVVGHDVTFASCRFFLELSNWNLQAAVGAYFDFGFENSPSAGNPLGVPVIRPLANSSSGGWLVEAPQLSVRLQAVPPASTLILGPAHTSPPLRVHMENNGRVAWPPGCRLVVPFPSPNSGTVAGERMSWWDPLGDGETDPVSLEVPALGPGDVAELQVGLRPPHSAGDQQCFVARFSLCQPNGTLFGTHMPLYALRSPDCVSFHVHVSTPSSLPPSPPSLSSLGVGPWPSFPGPLREQGSSFTVPNESSSQQQFMVEASRRPQDTSLVSHDDEDVQMEEL